MVDSSNALSVIGGGAWGTALANLAANNGVKTLLWAREPQVVSDINARHVNTQYLGGVALQEQLRATGQLAALAEHGQALLCVVPVQYLRAVIKELKPLCAPDLPIALCSKGIERGSNFLPSQIFEEMWSQARLAVLSGPSFAADVARGLPTAVTLACVDDALAEQWAAMLAAPHFRPYRSRDILGTELGGAVKNVLAIAAGAVEGRGLGESARAALIARGFTEFQRLAVAMGAKAETLGGLSGLGDLILTATSQQSRNMSLGYALGKGTPLEEILATRNSVSEGVATAAGVVALGERAGVELPICRAVADLVSGARTVDAIITDLLARPLKEEGI